MAGFFMRGRIGGMKYRRLRIAWTAFWGLACVLLIVLWVRSYYRWDMIARGWGTPSKQAVCFSSQSGAIVLIYDDLRANQTAALVDGWKVTILDSPDNDLFP